MTINTSRPVAAPRDRSYVLRLRSVCLCLGLAIGACAPPQPAAHATPAVLDVALVDSVETATAPQQPLHVTFDWAMTDRDARFSGKGVVRVAPPYRARLDLFGPRGETYVIAVLDGRELRLAPAGAAEMLPPPAFLWASLGVFRRPEQPLTESGRTEDGAALAFADAQERWRFALNGSGLRQVEWLGPDNGRRTVELTGRVSSALPQRGAYRDWLAFRELTLTVTAVENVNGFSDDIWSLDARQ